MKASGRIQIDRPFRHVAITMALAAVMMVAAAGPASAVGTEKEPARTKPATEASDLPVASRVAPPNDDFVDARSISGSSGSVTGMNVGATGEPGEPDNAGSSAPIQSVWYSWTAPADGSWSFDTCGSDFDTTLGVYTGTSVSALTEVGSDDDTCDRQSSVTFLAAGGTVYSISVDGYLFHIGHVLLNWVYVPAPLNDNFSQPLQLTGTSGSVPGTNLAATAQPGEPDNAGVSMPIQSVWFRWHAPLTGTYTFDTCGGELDSTLGIYRGAAIGSLRATAQNDDDLTNACALNSRAILDAVAGVTYRISVDGYLDRAAPFVLNWSPLTCTITGTSGPDDLVGTDADDVICGLGGADSLRGGAGFDILVGGSKRDRLLGESDDDYALGGTGADQFDGGTGADNLNSVDGRSSDAIIGDSSDLCYGDPGDSITGC